MNRGAVPLIVACLVVFATPPAHARRIVAMQNGSAPGGATFSDPQTASIEDNGDIVFVDGARGVYLESNRVLLVLSPVGGTPIGGGNLGTFSPAALPRAFNGAFTFPGQMAGKTVLLRMTRTGSNTVLVREGDTVGGALVGYLGDSVATDAQGFSVIQVGQGGVFALDPAGTPSVAYQIGQALPGMPGFMVTGLADRPQLLDDGRLLIPVQAENSSAVARTIGAVLVKTGAALAVLQPAITLAQGDIWSSAGMVAGRPGNLAVAGAIHPSTGEAPRRAVWVGPSGALAQVLAFPLTLDGMTIDIVAPKAMGTGNRFAARAHLASGGEALLWFDGAAAQLVARPGSEAPGHAGLTLTQIAAIAVGGDPDVLVFSAYCTLATQPGGTCTAILRYDTATRTLTTVAATGDMWNAGAATGVMEILQPRLAPFFGAGYGTPISNAGLLVWDAIVRTPSGTPTVLFAEDEAGAAPAPPMGGPDVAVTITGSRFKDLSGKFQFSVTVAVTNAANAQPAGSVDVAISSSLDVNLFGSSPCSGAGKSFACSFGAMAAGATANVQFRAEVAPGAPLVQATATVIPADVNLANNSATYQYQAKDKTTGGGSPLAVTTALALTLLWLVVMFARRRIRLG